MSHRIASVVFAMLVAAILFPPAVATEGEVQAEAQAVPSVSPTSPAVECPPDAPPPIRVVGAETDAPECLINDETPVARGGFNTIEDVFAAELPAPTDPAGSTETAPGDATPVVWREAPAAAPRPAGEADREADHEADGDVPRD